MLHLTADKSGILTLLTLFTADKSGVLPHLTADISAVFGISTADKSGVWLYVTADKTAIRTPADDAVRSADGGLKCDLTAC